jgi:ATPase subunit of ABC transporter with duplicated ATPase domains
MLVVSHDLPLLDEAITSVLALEHGELEAYRGNYTHYLVERDRRREQKERERASANTRMRRSPVSRRTSAASREPPRRWPRWPDPGRPGSIE